ncbi:uncharacterized protein HKW66_Vig0114420 [Vigna angularis]|uniref:Uncharacterized protein n=1 Tax=Phaseolus angularis TaxID=3914 RepID=A0A8T0KW18_PHAAN|nr:uncharacterized protein HKW66_Vig0114420 [Vigna angularis]
MILSKVESKTKKRKKASLATTSCMTKNPKYPPSFTLDCVTTRTTLNQESPSLGTSENEPSYRKGVVVVISLCHEDNGQALVVGTHLSFPAKNPNPD